MTKSVAIRAGEFGGFAFGSRGESINSTDATSVVASPSTPRAMPCIVRRHGGGKVANGYFATAFSGSPDTTCALDAADLRAASNRAGIATSSVMAPKTMNPEVR